MQTATLCTARMTVTEGPLMRRTGLCRMLLAMSGRVHGLLLCIVMDAVGCRWGVDGCNVVVDLAYHRRGHTRGYCSREGRHGDECRQYRRCHQSLTNAFQLDVKQRGFLPCVVVNKMPCVLGPRVHSNNVNMCEPVLHALLRRREACWRLNDVGGFRWCW